MAACDPASPVSNVTVTCTGTTTNANGTNGYGTAGDTGNTYNIVSGASVSGTDNGLVFFLLGTVNNFGTITGAGANRSGIFGETGTVNNSGRISGSGQGVKLQNGDVTNTFDANINGGIDGVKIEDQAKVSNAGGISGGVRGVSIGETGAGSVAEILNSGTISGGTSGVESLKALKVTNSGIIHAPASSSSFPKSGILSTKGVTVDNSGRILAVDGVAIRSDRADVVNSAGGTIGGGLGGIFANTTISLNNAGTVRSQGDGFGLSALTVNVSANTGTIAGGSDGTGINANLANVANANSGVISGRNAISASEANVANAGEILGGANGAGINAAIANVANSGVISARDAINATTANVANTNTGAILGGATGNGILADVASVTNSGAISAGQAAVAVATGAAVDNSGRILATGGSGIAINSSGSADVINRAGGKISGTSLAIFANTIDLNNAGTVSSADANGFGLSAVTVNVSANTGAIVGGRLGIDANFANVANSGVISGRDAINAGTANVANAGDILGGANGRGIAAGVASVTNSGTISGGIGINAVDPSKGSTIDNSGTIAGTGGTAIKLTSAADTLTLRAGSRITGVVDMGLGDDVVNVAVNAPNTRVSSLTSVALPTFINFTGTLNTSVSGGNNSNPAVTAGATIATLDPTALALADRALMDFTGGVSSLVQGRLNGVPPSANGSMMAMAYAADSSDTGRFVRAPGASGWSNAAPITVWANGFGGQRTHDETAATLRATNTAWSSALGIDRRIRPDWLLGAFIGGGSGRLSVDLGSQRVDTDYLFAGAYSRFEWAAQFFDFTVQGGSSTNKSERLVLNNGATETAKARYDGWFISPELAYGMRYQIGNGYLLTPTARVRYIAGFFDGYSEQGSAQTLTVGSRTLQNFEERGQLEVSKTTSFFGGDHTLKTSVHGGVIAQQRVGDATVSTVVIGQGLSFATPGKGSTVGAVFGAGFDYHTARNVALFGAVEGIAMSDQSRIGIARGGLRVAF